MRLGMHGFPLWQKSTDDGNRRAAAVLAPLHGYTGSPPARSRRAAQGTAKPAAGKAAHAEPARADTAGSADV
ncbi:hypothetical protein [Slackia exigua]|uniref:hypothetical protein n=1 Tax=Slackia exigua TaxID=84109 RepID=UPI00210D5C3D|nr:hypothetical protein [Slackia exigua]MCQ5092105.1 hypothetical protein [Slackia exigua]